MKRQCTFPTLSDQPFFCFPESVGRYWEEPHHDVNRNVGAWNNFNIHFVLDGKGYVELDGKAHLLKKGDAVLYFPMQGQRYYSCTNEPWDVRWVHFYGNKLQEFMLEQGFHRFNLWTLRQIQPIEQAHRELLDEAEAYKLLNPTKLSTLTYALIAEFINQATPLTANKSNDVSEQVLSLLPLMQSEACQPFVLQDWAERAGISTYYFCRLFRKALQMSPLDFITRCRLQVSKQWLLERKDATIGQIAVEAGYPSASYFNKRFMEHEGMTPTDYRRLHLNNRSVGSHIME
jgi:AraC-like DNA-binding protein